MRRLSEINLGLYRTLLQPFVRAFASEQVASRQHELQPSELPFELFSDRNPLMRQVAQLAEQVREQRSPCSPDNPFVKLQGMVSSQIIAALDGWRDLRDQSVEQIFLTIYGHPVLQALIGLRASDESPRRHPGVEPERLALIEKRIAQLRARVEEEDCGKRPFAAWSISAWRDRVWTSVLSRRCAGSAPGRVGLTLQEFKALVREQFFALLLDRKRALAAVPKMLPNDPATRNDILAKIRRVASAVGKPEGVRAERLAEMERLFGATVDA